MNNHQLRRIRNLCLICVLSIALVACGGDNNPVPTATSTAASTTGSETAVAQQPTPAVVATTEAVATSQGEQTPVGQPTTAVKADIGASGDGSVDTSGNYVSDIGFRPDYNGFQFPNYGTDIPVTNLTAADLQRMFGDQACAVIRDGVCTLTPAGEQWMQQINQGMGGGHCEGMAVLSKLFYAQKLNVADFGANSVPELQIAGNERLQREIAYWFTTQSTQPARNGIVAQTPSGVLNTLMTSLAAGPSGGATYAVGFYKRDRTGGHAVTPYAVEDRGNGVFWIMVYDNNYPKAARAIEVDTNTDTWRYTGSTNPAEPADDYEGDAQTNTLELAPIESRLDKQACPFCSQSEGSAAKAPGASSIAGVQAGQAPFNEVRLTGDANLLITDAEGRGIGFKDGQFVNEIPGARSNANKYGVDVWDIKAEPVYYIPTNIDFTISIDGSQLAEPSLSTVTFVGPGYVLEVNNIKLDPGQVDVLDIAPDGSLLSYRTTSNESPVMLVGIETKVADYLFAVRGYEMATGEAVKLSLDTEKGWLSLDSIDNTNSALYSLYVAKYDDQGEQIFGADDVGLDPNDVVYVDYLKWAGNGQPMELEIDRGADGQIDESLQVPDATDKIPGE